MPKQLYGQNEMHLVDTIEVQNMMRFAETSLKSDDYCVRRDGAMVKWTIEKLGLWEPEKESIMEKERRVISAGAVVEAKKVIESLIKTGTESGKYMASGGNVILTILGLDDWEEEELC